MNEPLIFLSNDDFGRPALEALIAQKYNIDAVITKPDRPVGRGLTVTSSSIKVIAESNNIKLLQPAKINEIKSELKTIQPVLGILISYGAIIPSEIIEIFPLGIINIHPSLLPKYRGPSPIETVILDNANETGVSLMKLTNGIDAGPIYDQIKLKLNGAETSRDLYEALSKIGAQILITDLIKLLKQQLKPLPQNDRLATFCSKIDKTSGIIDWNKPAVIIEREIRAYDLWPKSHTKIGHYEVIITAAHVEKLSGPISKTTIQKNQLIIYCGQDALVIDRLKPAGKGEMLSKDFLAGHHF